MDILDVGLKFSGLFISLAAFFRPELSRWLKRAFGSLTFYDLGSIDIGVDQHGPVICLRGSIVAPVFDRLITKITIDLQVSDGHPSLVFEWWFFRSTEIPVADGQVKNEGKLQFCSPFLVKRVAPELRDIVFISPQLRRGLFSGLGELKKVWKSYLLERGNPTDEETRKKLLGQFIKDYKAVEDAINTVGAVFMGIWKQQKYRAALKLHTDHPQKVFNYEFEFELNNSEVSGLEKNFGALLELIFLDRGNIVTLAYPEITKVTPA